MHEVETMAWRGATPWHGLGTEIKGALSTNEMMVAAGLDWRVKQYPVYANVDGVETEIKNRRALVRETDKKILTFTGENWKPVQNKQIFDFFREFVEAGKAEIETAGSLRGGRIVWALASTKQGFTIGNRDVTRGYMLLTSRHEIGNCTTASATSVRVVCANTLALSEGKDPACYRQNHHGEFNADKARDAFGIARERLATYELEAKALASLRMSNYDTVRTLAKFFAEKPEDAKETAWIKSMVDDAEQQPKTMQQIIDSYYDAPGAAPGTAWGVLQAVTHWADHTAGHKADARLYNSWLGATGDVKREVKQALLEMAR